MQQSKKNKIIIYLHKQRHRPYTYIKQQDVRLRVHVVCSLTEALLAKSLLDKQHANLGLCRVLITTPDDTLSTL